MFNYDESIFAEKEIAVSAEQVWAILATPACLVRWHPFMAKNPAERWNGVGSKDHLTYYSGFEFDREVVYWQEGVGFDLRVTENGKRECTSSWRITPLDEKRCNLRITCRILYIKKLPFLIRWALLEFKMKPVFSKYLGHDLKGFAYYAETGKQVTRNQFGFIPMFSPEE